MFAMGLLYFLGQQKVKFKFNILAIFANDIAILFASPI